MGGFLLMSEFLDALTDCETDLHEQIPTTFTVDGVSGEFACLIDTKTDAENLSVGGMRGEVALTIGFLRSVSYTPNNGDEITVDGAVWTVSSVRSGPVKWELTLISKDE